MTSVRIPEVVNEHTKICRICLIAATDLYSIHDFGKVCNKTVKISDLLSECTSIEFHRGDALPETLCSDCLLQTCKIYKFREMAFKSNVLLRQKVAKTHFKNEILPIKKQDHTRNKMILSLNKTEMVDLKDANVVEELIETNEIEEADNDVQYVTVILENDESTEDSETNIEVIEEASEEETIHDGEYIMTEESMDEIPKMSLKRQRNRRRTKSSDNRSLTCPECGKVLSNFSSFKYHMQLHSEETPFLCSECGIGFKTRNAYDGHLITHNPENPNKCEICGKTYRQAASLRSHMLTHTGEKPFKCDICGKGMTQKSGYKKHLLTHSGEKPHSCDQCGREFRYSSNLIMHKRSHIGNKDFECTVCKKKFISKEQLKRHAAIHTGVKPHKCESCGKCFNRRSTLTIHQKIHVKITGEHPKDQKNEDSQE